MIFVINLSLRFISLLGRFPETFLRERTTCTGVLYASFFHSLSLYPLHLSLLSLPPSLYLSFYLSLSLFSIILFGVSNGRFRPCFYGDRTWITLQMTTRNVDQLTNYIISVASLGVRLFLCFISLIVLLIGKSESNSVVWAFVFVSGSVGTYTWCSRKKKFTDQHIFFYILSNTQY